MTFDFLHLNDNSYEKQELGIGSKLYVGAFKICDFQIHAAYRENNSEGT